MTVEWGGSGRAMGQAMQEPRAASSPPSCSPTSSIPPPGCGSVGDAAWRDQLAAHNARLREQLNVFRGREVKTTATACWRCSTARPARSAARPRWSPPATRWASRSGSACTRARWRSSATTCEASPSTWRPGSGLAGAGEVVLTPTTADLEGRARLEDAGEHELRGWPAPAGCGGWRRGLTPAATPVARRSSGALQRPASRRRPAGQRFARRKPVFRSPGVQPGPTNRCSTAGHSALGRRAWRYRERLRAFTCAAPVSRLLGEALFLPGVGVVVVAVALPEAQPVVVEELQAADPLGLFQK